MYEVVDARSVLVSKSEIGTNRVYLVKNDRLTNPFHNFPARVLEQVPE